MAFPLVRSKRSVTLKSKDLTHPLKNPLKLSPVSERSAFPPRMWKGSRAIPWPGNSWMPFTFQPALRALQQPHEHSNSLQLTNHTLVSRVSHLWSTEYSTAVPPHWILRVVAPNTRLSTKCEIDNDVDCNKEFFAATYLHLHSAESYQTWK